MHAVYFPEALADSLPSGALSYFYTAPDNLSASIVDIVQAIRRGEVVTIRPATASELKRMESFIALYGIGQQLGEKLGTLLDQDPESLGKFTLIRDAIESAGDIEMLDREPGAPCPFPEGPEPQVAVGGLGYNTLLKD